MEASNLCTFSRCITILLHDVHDSPCASNAAIARHVNFA